MATLPKAPVKRIIESAGAARVSDEATVALADVLEEYAVEIAERAIKLAKHAGRKTIKAEDIELAQ
ncbi:MAG: histone [Methanosphaera sp. rholeuAM130]|nr:histone family protein [Methanosphaera sp.]RAP53588.1 MAG: histone [Methanosphaera sp. rholeuAM130]